ncbi:hypothetical protein TELCIR_11669, partial [Teladorsagia circumcincta]
ALADEEDLQEIILDGDMTARICVSHLLNDDDGMLKRKLQDLTVCCSYQVEFLHQKAHSAKEFRRQYTVLEEIGRGGFGIVYRAVRIADGLPVAVKFVEHKHVREWTLVID